MKLDPEETILLTREEYERMLEICRNPPEPTEYMLEAARQYRERLENDTTRSPKSC